MLRNGGKVLAELRCGACLEEKGNLFEFQSSGGKVLSIPASWPTSQKVQLKIRRERHTRNTRQPHSTGEYSYKPLSLSVGKYHTRTLKASHSQERNTYDMG